MAIRERRNLFLRLFNSGLDLTSVSGCRPLARLWDWIFRSIYDDRRMLYEKGCEAECKIPATLRGANLNSQSLCLKSLCIQSTQMGSILRPIG